MEVEPRNKRSRMLSGKAPFVTIITVVYNGLDVLEETILSVIGQSYPHFEYLLIDGGSTDGTLDIVHKYHDQIDYWKSEPDRGIYDAMNKGIAAANGEWIIFMNAGDRFAGPEVLSIFEERTFEADIIYGDAMVEYPGFSTLFKKYPLPEMWKRMPFCHQATFVRASLMKAHGFDLRYKLSSDFNFLYQSYHTNIKFQYIDKVICHFDFKTGASKKQAFLSFKERKQIVLAHETSPMKVLYYVAGEIYLYVSSLSKQILGNRLSGWVTRLLKK